MTADWEDDPSLDSFVKANFGPLQRYSRAVCLGTLIDPDELLQESLVDLIRCWRPLCASSAPDQDLYKEALSILLKWARKLRKEARRRSARERALGHDDELGQFDQEDEDSVVAFKRVEDASTEELLAGLDETEREVMVLRILGLSFEQSADVLGKTTGKVRGIFYRGRKTLESQLRARGGGRDE